MKYNYASILIMWVNVYILLCTVNFDDYYCLKFRILNQDLWVAGFKNTKQRTYTDNYRLNFPSVLLIQVLTSQMYIPVCNVAMSGRFQKVLPLEILHLNIANMHVCYNGNRILILYEASHCNLLQHNWCSYGVALIFSQQHIWLVCWSVI